jgi:hypothetical protein
MVDDRDIPSFNEFCVTGKIKAVQLHTGPLFSVYCVARKQAEKVRVWCKQLDKPEAGMDDYLKDMNRRRDESI